jgi:poly-beta-1,6-N-acetyl-D-glucosamine synthase
MMIVIEILLLLTTIFPLFHMIDALLGNKTKQINTNKHLGFSILIPCFNESVCVKKSVDSLLNIDYKNYEVIYINDGSVDDTLAKLKSILDLKLIKEGFGVQYYKSNIYENVFCINKPNTGKGLSLNIGLKYCKKDIIVTLDADSMLNPDCLKIMNSAFSEADVVAAGGAVHIMQAKKSDYFKKLNPLKRLLVGIQAVDYLKGFFIYKLSLSKQKALAIISGAFGVFRKDILLEVGGFRKSLGEDIDITIKIQKHIIGTDKKILFLPQAGCYTECPESINDLFKQRVRWQKGFLDCVIYYAKFLFNTYFKNTLSFYLVIEAFLVGYFSCLLPMLSLVYLCFNYSISIITIIGIYSIISVIFNIFYSLIAYITASRSKFPYKNKFIFAILLDIFVFRFFLLFVYLYGTIAYLINKTEWHKANRSILLAKKEEKYER